jgi:hypothetical protein
MHMDVGDEAIYRLRDYAPSERVRIVAFDGRKKNPRHEMEFLNDRNGGTQENVPDGRLRGPWAGVAQDDELMANWERLDRVQLTDHEESAVSTVFDLLVPEDTAEWEGSAVGLVVSDLPDDLVTPLGCDDQESLLAPHLRCSRR